MSTLIIKPVKVYPKPFSKKVIDTLRKIIR